ncbi:MAG: pitrilysin family protein [Bacteroidia bacterium]|nr:pitrilysin family protein [Bacteroidia bacterium]
MKKTILYIILPVFIFAAGYSCTQKSGSAQMPAPGETPAIHIESPQTFKLDNGLTVLVVENHRLPRVNMVLVMDFAPKPEADKAGTSFLLTQMLGTGTKNMNKESFNEKLDFLGATLTFNQEGASASGLSGFFPEILELMSTAIVEPRFNRDEFDVQKEIRIEEIRNRERDVSSITNRVFSALTFGLNSAYGEIETEQTLRNIDLKDVEAAHKEIFVPNNAYLAIVGDVTLNEAKPLIEEHFANWKRGESAPATVPKPENPEEVEIDIVNVPDAVQANIVIGNVHDIKVNSPAFFAAHLSNAILGGGSLNTRLNSNLRERNGFTYGASSQINYDKYNPSFSAEASVSNKLVPQAIKEFMAEFNNITAITEEDLRVAKARMKGNFTLSMENPATIAGMGMNILTEDLPQDFYVNYLKSIDNLTVEDVQNAAQEYLKTNNLRIIVVGNAAEFRTRLEELPYLIRYYDTKGNRVR